MPEDRTAAQRIDARVGAAPPDRDTLLFVNGDELAGRVIALSPDHIKYQSGGRELAVERGRVAAMVFKRGAAKTAGKDRLAVWVGLRDGSRLLVDRFILNGDRVNIELPGGARLSASRGALAALQPIAGDVVYLSDWDDAGYRHIPFLSLSWEYRRDRSATDGPLIAAGGLYLKGLGMHSAARITYNLDATYGRFQSMLAIDDSTGRRGSVSCRVFIDDGSGKWQAKYESPIIRGGDKPTPVDIDVRGAKRISLLVDFADRGDEQDHVDWLEARLIK
jgi:hypothetical protein